MKKTSAPEMPVSMPPMPPDAGMMPEAPVSEGTVMVQMPKEAFTAIHALVTQLAMGLDSLAATVDQQAAAEGEMAMAEGGAPMPPMPSTAPDEAELAAFAEELSQRGIV